MLRQGAVLLVALLAVVTGGLIAVEQNATYSFSPEAVNSLAQQALKQAGENATAAKKVQTTVALVQQQYPNITSQNPKWLFNNAGGAMGSMLVLHASFSEYLIIFGTSIGTDGHSGRFRAHDYFHVLHGEQWATTAGSFTKRVYLPGDVHKLSEGKVEHYKMPDECWALEYAYGNIVTMLPFGIVEVFSSTLDFPTLFDTVYESARNMLANARIGKV